MRNRFLIRLFILICLCPCFSQNGYAQKAGDPRGATDKPLQQQFDDMVANSNRFQDYRVIPLEWVNAMKANVQDSLSGNVEKIKRLTAEIEAKNTQLADQSAVLAAKSEEVGQLEKEKEGITFFGKIIPKSLYNTLVWALIGLLGAAVLVAMASGKAGLSKSRELRKTVEELSEELEKSKRRRLEVEQDLRRQLQDQILKIEALKKGNS